jgi:hypothetical protein
MRMAWRIHSWSPATETGAVASDHLGPWGFGPEQNPSHTLDFEIGEEVLVELDRTSSGYVVRSVTAARHRQPEGTECHAFDEINADRPSDVHIEDRTASELRFMLVDCCTWCSAWSWCVVFREPSAIVGLDDDTDLASPLFRFASSAELEAHGLEVPPGHRAYSMVNNHGSGPDGPLVFIVAKGVEVERCVTQGRREP